MRRVGVMIGAMVASLGLAANAGAADFGVKTVDGSPAGWTRIDKGNTTAWRLKVVEILKTRGFSDTQIQKFSRLKYTPPGPNDTPLPFPVPYGVKKGILTFQHDDLPVLFNTETGKPMPLDPIDYAKALPDCYAQDERSCTFTYSAQAPDNDDLTKPCLVPRRTQLFCKKVGFTNAQRGTLSLSVAVANYAPSCGEQRRGNGCGASEVSFDFGEESTKLAFAIDQAEQTAAATPAPVEKAAPIVIKVDQASAFVSRTGPAEREEWEQDFTTLSKLYKQQMALQGPSGEVAAKNKAKYDAIVAAIDKLRDPKALQYCWPHDVFHPCDME